MPSPSASNSAPTWARESHWVEYCRDSVTVSSAQTSTYLGSPKSGISLMWTLKKVAALVQHGAAGEVERQAQAEADAGLHLGDALEDLLGGYEVDAAELVVVAPVAPGRAVRALLPPLRHRSRLRCTSRPAGLA